MEEETTENDEPELTPEEEAERQALWLAAEAEWEAEATAAHGPPALRARKNARYVSRLVRKHGEQTIREMLKALSTLDNPFCASNLVCYDVGSTPLAEVIQPFELGGLHFHIDSVSHGQYTIRLGAAHGRMGSGGTILLERLGDGTFRVEDTLREWIA